METNWWANKSINTTVPEGLVIARTFVWTFLFPRLFYFFFFFFLGVRVYVYLCVFCRSIEGVYHFFFFVVKQWVWYCICCVCTVSFFLFLLQSFWNLGVVWPTHHIIRGVRRGLNSLMGHSQRYRTVLYRFIPFSPFTSLLQL